MKTSLQVTKFGGLDERKTFESELSYATEMKNFRITENFTLKKREGLTACALAPTVITGMWSGYLGTRRYFLFTAGEALYRLDDGMKTAEEIGNVGEGKNVMFEFNRRVYIKNQNKYTSFDGETFREVTGYVPLVAIGCRPDGAGERFEDINLLSPYRRVQFIGDGSSRDFRLPETDLASIGPVLINGRPSPYPIRFRQLGEGRFGLDGTPAEGEIVEVTYQAKSDRRDVILKASGVMLFGGDTDGHVFLWGNPDAPNVRYHSELADGQPSAEYFPENNYTVIGDSEITDIVSQYDRQLIFTKDRAFYSYCELQTDVPGNVYASFPVYNLNGEKGNLLKNTGCIVNNEPVTLCADGLNRWTSTTVENEKNAVCFSGAVGNTMRALLAKGQFDSLLLFNLRATGELFFFCGGGKVLIYQYRIGVWYAYDGIDADYLVEHDGNLYIASGARILFLDPENGADILDPFDAVWESPYLSFRERVRLSRVDWTLRGEGDVQLTFSFGGSGRDRELPPGAAVPVNHIRKDCGEGRVCSGSFRPGGIGGGMPVLSRTKLRITETDDAIGSELSELRLLATRKGRYARNGIQ